MKFIARMGVGVAALLGFQGAALGQAPPIGVLTELNAAAPGGGTINDLDSFISMGPGGHAYFGGQIDSVLQVMFWDGAEVSVAFEPAATVEAGGKMLTLGYYDTSWTVGPNGSLAVGAAVQGGLQPALVLRRTNGTYDLVADDETGPPGGGTYDSFGQVAFADDGSLHFSAFSGVFRYGASGSLLKVVGPGDDVPNTADVTFTQTALHGVLADGTAVIVGSTDSSDDPPAGVGIWLAPSGSLTTPFAVQGDTAPGGGTYEVVGDVDTARTESLFFVATVDVGETVHIERAFVGTPLAVVPLTDWNTPIPGDTTHRLMNVQFVGFAGVDPLIFGDIADPASTPDDFPTPTGTTALYVDRGELTELLRTGDPVTDRAGCTVRSFKPGVSAGNRVYTSVDIDCGGALEYALYVYDAATEDLAFLFSTVSPTTLDDDTTRQVQSYFPPSGDRAGGRSFGNDAGQLALGVQYDSGDGQAFWLVGSDVNPNADSLTVGAEMLMEEDTSSCSLQTVSVFGEATGPLEAHTTTVAFTPPMLVAYPNLEPPSGCTADVVGEEIRGFTCEGGSVASNMSGFDWQLPVRAPCAAQTPTIVMSVSAEATFVGGTPIAGTADVTVDNSGPEEAVGIAYTGNNPNHVGDIQPGRFEITNHCHAEAPIRARFELTHGEAEAVRQVDSKGEFERKDADCTWNDNRTLGDCQLTVAKDADDKQLFYLTMATPRAEGTVTLLTGCANSTADFAFEVTPKTASNAPKEKCACRLPGGTRGESRWAWLGALVAVQLLRRRRRE